MLVTSAPNMSLSHVGMPARTTIQLYRDCLRLVFHIAGRVRADFDAKVKLDVTRASLAQSTKGQQLRALLGNEFRKNADVTDPDQVEKLKSGYGDLHVGAIRPRLYDIVLHTFFARARAQRDAWTVELPPLCERQVRRVSQSQARTYTRTQSENRIARSKDPRMRGRIEEATNRIHGQDKNTRPAGPT